MKIFCAIDLNSEERSYFKKKVSENQLLFKNEIGENSVEAFFDCEICFGNISPDWVERSIKLKWLQLESVGFDAYLKLEGQNLPTITNLRGFLPSPLQRQ